MDLLLRRLEKAFEASQKAEARSSKLIAETAGLLQRSYPPPREAAARVLVSCRMLRTSRAAIDGRQPSILVGDERSTTE